MTVDVHTVSRAHATSQTPVLILGGHLAALGVLRLLTRRGVPAFVAEETTNVVARSRWYRPAERTLPETSDASALATYLDSLRLPRAVLIACSDQWSLAVAGLPEEIRARFPASSAPLEAIQGYVDKDRFRALVDQLDIPRPRTILIREPGDLDLVTDDQLANGFLKPTESHLHNKRFGTKGYFSASRDDARRRIEEAHMAGITFMLQEWIPGGTSRFVLIDGFVDRHGTISGVLARRRLRMEPPRLANTALSVTIPLEEVEACIAPLRKLLEATGHRGIFDAEFKFDERDGQFKIIELNPRPFWHTSHVAMAGIDLAWMSYLDAQELAVPVAAPYQVGRYGMYEVFDAAAILRAWTSFRRPEGPVIRPWLTADRSLFWFRDPLPALFGAGQAVGRRLDRVLRRLGRGAQLGTRLDR